jgi:hypothetical protein
MNDDPDIQWKSRLDLDLGADRALDELTRKANAFGGALSTALKQATVEGRGLDDVLRGLGNRMISIALDAGMRPARQPDKQLDFRADRQSRAPAALRQRRRSRPDEAHSPMAALSAHRRCFQWPAAIWD